MLLHEFIFVLGKIALKTKMITDTDNPTISEKLKILFVEKLKLKEVMDPEEFVEQNYQ